MSYQTNIERAARENQDFRRVLYTTKNTQLVLMTVQPGDDVGLEVHDLDQVLVFVSGQGKSYLGGKEGSIGPGTVTVVPAGTEHNFVNTGSDPLRLYTVYSPPEHAPGTVHATKEEAERAEAEEHGRPAPTQGVGRTFSVGSLKGAR